MSAPVPRSSEVGSARGLRHAFRALHHRDFAFFWSGALVSNIGTWMQQLTIPFVVFALTGSAAWIGFAAFLQFFPMMAMNSIGGVLADRFSRKRLIVITQVLQMMVALGLWALWASGHHRPGLIVGVVAVAGVIAGIQIPAWQSFVPQLVPREHLLNAVTLNSAQFNVARALGPAVGGLVLAAWGPGAAFLLNAVSYLFVLGALAFVSAGEPSMVTRATGRLAGEFWAGLRYTRRHTGLVLAVVIVAFAGFLGAPIVQFTPVFAEDVYGVGEVAYGILTAAMGVGAVVGAVILGAYGDDVRRSRLAIAGLFSFGVTAVAMGAVPAYGMGLVALLMMGGAYIVIASSLNTAIQVLVAEEMRGRVLAIYMMAFTGSFPIGALVQGRVADLLGMQMTVAVAGALLAVLAMVLRTRPSLVSALDTQAGDEEVGAVGVPATVAATGN